MLCSVLDLEYGNGASTAQINHPSVNVRSTVTRSIAQSSTLAYDVALASELKSGSVMDILGKGAVSSASSNPLLFSAGGGPEKEKNGTVNVIATCQRCFAVRLKCRLLSV